MSSDVRAPGREHIPNYPKGFVTIRILQLIFSLVSIGLNSYTLSYFAFTGNCIAIFTALITFSVTVWLVTAHTCAPRAYNYWAVLAFDLFLYIFWLASFGVLAAETAAYLFVSNDYLDDYCNSYYNDCSDYNYGLSDAQKMYGGVMGASAGIGALEFLFFFISLIIHSVVVFRHRRAGLHSRPLSSSTGPDAASASAPIQMNVQPNKTHYDPVPQQGMPPFHGQQQNTAYDPNQMYAGGFPPQQQQQFSPHASMSPQSGYYSPEQVATSGGNPMYWQQEQQRGSPTQQQQQQYMAPVIMPQPTGASQKQTVSPSPSNQGGYAPPPPAAAYPQQPHPQEQYPHQLPSNN